DLQGLGKSAILAALAGSPVYGMDEKHLREKVSRLFLRPVPFHADERHVVQQYRRVAAAPFGDSAAAML
ncbi:MAG: lipopolysaccharide heptosyltransferase I, partial [Zetaproteobacteria bacterium CG_4_8_14_3_um_filter_59_5]